MDVTKRGIMENDSLCRVYLLRNKLSDLIERDRILRMRSVVSTIRDYFTSG